jgi:MFS family permease
MGDLVDDSHRGRWFAKRNFITGFVSVILAVVSSYFLDYFNSIGKQMYGFIILFFLAGVSRFYSGFCFKKQYEPRIIIKEEDNVSLSDFVLNLKKDNFGRFAFFRALLAFACSISAPLVAIYLIKELNFSYFVYMILIMSGTVYSLIFLEFWGKFSDKYGNFRTIAITSVFIPLVPILWVIYPNPLFLLFIASLVNGFAWSGFDLASSNFIYDNLSSGKRAQLLSYYHVLIGVGTFVGASISAILIKFIPFNFFIKPIILIFFLGSFVRMIVIYFFMGNLNEIRKTKKFTGANIFKRMFLKESFSTLKHEANQIMEIPKYVFDNEK